MLSDIGSAASRALPRRAPSAVRAHTSSQSGMDDRAYRRRNRPPIGLDTQIEDRQHVVDARSGFRIHR